MSTDELPESEVVARLYCPECEPDLDPTKECVYVKRCVRHTPTTAGSDDHRVTDSELVGGAIPEAGGDLNRRWCERVHGTPMKHEQYEGGS